MIVSSAVPPTTTTLTPITEKELERKTKKNQTNKKQRRQSLMRNWKKNIKIQRCDEKMRNASAQRG